MMFLTSSRPFVSPFESTTWRFLLSSTLKSGALSSFFSSSTAFSKAYSFPKSPRTSQSAGIDREPFSEDKNLEPAVSTTCTPTGGDGTCLTPAPWGLRGRPDVCFRQRAHARQILRPRPFQLRG